MVTHLDPDILEGEVKWAFRKHYRASGSGGIPAELFKILKDDAIKVLHSICLQIGKPSSGHRTGKGQTASQFPRRAVSKNVHTIGQLYSSPMLERSCSISCMLHFSIMCTKSVHMSKLGLEKTQEPEIKLPTFAGS